MRPLGALVSFLLVSVGHFSCSSNAPTPGPASTADGGADGVANGGADGGADALNASCASCDVFAHSCPNGERCSEVLTGGTSVIQCGPDKAGTGVTGTVCLGPTDCADGYNCVATGKVLFTCAAVCRTMADCSSGQGCVPFASGCPAELKLGWCQ